jgi:ubiquinone/menaquinone biosynthesis C-methylase UbiE
LNIDLTCPNCSRNLLGAQDENSVFTCSECRDVSISNGVLDARALSGEAAEDRWAIEYYDRVADIYDAYLPLTFETFGCDEDTERKKMYDRLVKARCKSVLEVGCGTGRDSIRLVDALDSLQTFHYQDISLPILKKAVTKIENLFPHIDQRYHCSNAHKLPYQDKQFDAVYHFGGLNTFDNKKAAIKEMHRVTKDGGVIVIGDESIPPWYRETEFSEVLINSNPHYDFEMPLADLPSEISDVEAKWIIGGVFYTISFIKNESAPHADFHLEIPGERGGTHFKRYFGRLEGISPELRELLNKEAFKQQISRVDLLESIIKKYLYG